jgi:DtxR family Mn-dependent transcriptional regulator
MIRNALRGIENLSACSTDYLMAIYALEEDGQAVTTGALARKLNLTPASVTGMLQKLAQHKPRLVNYARYRGVSLTPAGRAIALQLIRRHRLLELYLVNALGYDWDEVDAEARQLVHATSDEFEAKIASALGDPTLDPHGDPIPSPDGRIGEPGHLTLSAVRTGETVRVRRVGDDPALLHYLAELGIRPQAVITVTEKSPFDGPIHIKVNEHACALGRTVADEIFVEAE